MSASEQSSRQSRSLGSRSRKRLRTERGSWFLVSLALHILALAGLVYLTPVRQIVRELVRRTAPQKTMSATALADLAEAIEERAAEQIAENAGELERVFGKITQIQDSMSDEFAGFETRQRENAARDALREMERAVEQMEGAVGSIEEDVSIEATDRLQALAEQAQQRAGRKLDMIQFDVADVTAQQRRAEEAHQQAKSTHDEHRDKISQVQARERVLTTERTRADQLRTQLQQMEDSGKPEEEIERQAASLAQQDQRVGESAEEFDAREGERAELHEAAAEAQKLALAAQRQAVDALREAVEEHQRRVALGWPAERDAAVGETAALPAPKHSGPQRRVEQLGTDVPRLYEGARTLEDEIAESFKEVRAMDLAMVRDMKLEDARGDIDVVRPVRPDLDAELLRTAVRTDDRFEAHKEELQVALRETASMVNLAHRMLEMSTQSVAKMKFGSDLEGAEPLETPDFQLIIRELAMEDVSGRFSDMAAMMLALEQQEGAGPRRTVDFEDLTELLGQGPTPLFGEDGAEQGDLPQLAPDVAAVGARKISPGGRPGRWMFIDTWYTLGPFPNPNRVNIDREFPPDSLIDLDATYIGKGGRTIRWQFVQSEKPEIKPPNAQPYGIWYAYTEFYCDEPRDLLIALGTDDRGTLKINGVPVWISSKRLKGWDIDEVWRRVHFRKGVNRILYRVENGWQYIGFSLVLRLGEGPEQG